jgi:multidrug resistance efflux pump
MDSNEIMALADTYADGPHIDGYFGAHREALRAAIEALQAANAKMRQDCADAGNALAQVEQENEALQADARRYRWLQEHTATTGISSWMRDIQFLDDAVDAAMDKP